MSEVKSLCTAAELALVKASRKPELEKLKLAEAKQHAQRARKLFDKWQDQGRNQARTRSRAMGGPDLDTRTQVKEQIFQEALAAFEGQAAKLEKTTTASAKGATAKVKKARAASHRADRADVRADLKDAKLTLNTKKKAAKKAALKSTTAASKPAPDKAATKAESKKPIKRATAKATSAGDAPAPAKNKVAKKGKPAPASVAQPEISTTKSKQRSIGARVKDTLMKLSGRTTRMQGHTQARGQRKQARRDQRG